MEKGSSAKLETRIYKRSPHVLFRSNEDGEVSIMKINEMEAYFSLDKWAARVWNLMDGKNTVGSIVTTVEKESKLSRTFLLKETGSLISDLEEQNLIEKRT